MQALLFLSLLLPYSWKELSIAVTEQVHKTSQAKEILELTSKILEKPEILEKQNTFKGKLGLYQAEISSNGESLTLSRIDREGDREFIKLIEIKYFYQNLDPKRDLPNDFRSEKLTDYYFHYKTVGNFKTNEVSIEATPYPIPGLSSFNQDSNPYFVGEFYLKKCFSKKF